MLWSACNHRSDQCYSASCLGLRAPVVTLCASQIQKLLLVLGVVVLVTTRQSTCQDLNLGSSDISYSTECMLPQDLIVPDSYTPEANYNVTLLLTGSSIIGTVNDSCPLSSTFDGSLDMACVDMITNTNNSSDRLVICYSTPLPSDVIIQVMNTSDNATDPPANISGTGTPGTTTESMMPNATDSPMYTSAQEATSGTVSGTQRTGTVPMPTCPPDGVTSGGVGAMTTSPGNPDCDFLEENLMWILIGGIGLSVFLNILLLLCCCTLCCKQRRQHREIGVASAMERKMGADYIIRNKAPGTASSLQSEDFIRTGSQDWCVTPAATINRSVKVRSDTFDNMDSAAIRKRMRLPDDLYVSPSRTGGAAVGSPADGNTTFQQENGEQGFANGRVQTRPNTEYEDLTLESRRGASPQESTVHHMLEASIESQQFRAPSVPDVDDSKEADPFVRGPRQNRTPASLLSTDGPNDHNSQQETSRPTQHSIIQDQPAAAAAPNPKRHKRNSKIVDDTIVHL